MALAPKPLLVVYHADCLDGAVSAWALAQSQGIDSYGDPRATYVPYSHHNTAISEDAVRRAVETGMEIYFVDVSPSRKLLDDLMQPGEALRVHILDHHKTAAERLKDHPASERLFIHIEPAMPSAGAMIWRHLMPEKPLPDVFAMIDKMDGSARGLKTPDDFAAAAMIDARHIRSIEDAFNGMEALIGKTRADMVAEGRHLAEQEDARIDRLFDRAGMATVPMPDGAPSLRVPIVHADISQYGRRISSRLAALGRESGCGFALCWAERPGGRISVSLRSDGNPDVCRIAEHIAATLDLDGGGHADAAAVHFDSYADFAEKMAVQDAG